MKPGTTNLPGGVDHRGARRHRDRGLRAGGADAIALDDDDGVGHRRAAGAVDERAADDGGDRRLRDGPGGAQRGHEGEGRLIAGDGGTWTRILERLSMCVRGASDLPESALNELPYVA